MARRRGFFAELAYQQQQAERRRRQQEAAAVRAHNATVREHERAQRAYERARAAAARASAADQKQQEREAARLYAEARKAEAEQKNAELASQLADTASILEWTLGVDDHVDLNDLRVAAEHPPFEAKGLDKPIEAPAMPNLTPAPQYSEPPAPRGLFGAAKKHAQAVQAAQQAHAGAVAEWERYKKDTEAWYANAVAQHSELEAQRLAKLADLRAVYEAECEQRERDAAVRNKELDDLINGLAFDMEDAITTYVGIVLADSVYPDCFPVEYDYAFDLATRELTLTAIVSPPGAIPTEKAYRWVKATDEITATAQPVTEQKNRYNNAVWQVAIRTLHEVFEADRQGKIHSIALSVETRTTHPATGQDTEIPFVVVSADRETFLTFDLSNVVSFETLKHLGAALSKSPFDLAAADTARGVRARKS
jgi:restriction system protein